MQLHNRFPNFFDIRRHGFRRVATVAPRVHLAKPMANAQEHITWLERAMNEGVSYVLFPELGLTGYTNGDLFHSTSLLNAAEDALHELVTWSISNQAMIFTVGMPLVVDHAVFNVGVTIHAGRILGVAPKSYPPEYREFYEGRHFGRAAEARSREITLLGQEGIPFGTDILMQPLDEPNFVLHVEICEDLWVPIPPSAHAALQGATVLANLSASNVTIGKSEYREMLVAMSSGKNLAVQMYAAAGYGESSSGMSWDGDGYIAERGTVLARNPRFERNGSIAIVDVDLDVLILERMRQGSFRQNATDNRREFRIVRFEEQMARVGLPPTALLTFRRDIDPLPFVPRDPAKLDERCEETLNIKAFALARKLESLPPDMRHLFMGYSGGRDSTLELLVCLRTLEILALPRTNLHCYSMPGPGTSRKTRNIAKRLPLALGTSFEEVHITGKVNAKLRSIGHDPTRWNESPKMQLIFQNAQALTRKDELFCRANQHGIVIGTGDLTESALGWCTFGADQYGYYNTNANVGKTLISHLIRWFAERRLTSKEDANAKKQLLATLGLAVSPELLPPDAVTGAISQDTEELIGPFELHDFFLVHFVRFGRSPYTIARMALHAFQSVKNPLTRQFYTLADITRWLCLFLTRFFPAQAKRAAMPEGTKVGLVCLDPRGDWRMPSDASPDAWLAELDAIPIDS